MDGVSTGEVAMSGAEGGQRLPGRVVERLARAIHEAYLADRMADRRAMGSEPALRSWDQLPEHLKAANRAQAEGYARHLDTVGYKIVQASGGFHERLVLPRAQLERLARAEHERWSRHKLSQGYHYGACRVEDGGQRRHPSLVPWEELPEEVRDLDRQPLRRMFETLAAADLRVIPRG